MITPLYTYLLINIFSVAVPIAFSFGPKIRFYRNWKAIVSAITIPAILFIIWDSIFTEMGVWGFNPNYLTGIEVFNLPLEEILFFVAIPYCSLFTYEVLNYFVKRDVLGKYARHGATILAYVSVALAFKYSHQLYTFWTAIFAFLFLISHLVLLKRPYWSKLVFTYLVILIPFFIVNGLLTGTGLESPVVWYNDAENLGIRLLTIPAEDILYGFLLIGLNITVYEEIRR